MERVQFQQEQMLLELKDVVDKKLFTQKEVKQILKKRTAYEAALVRRIAKKADFLRYISYEMGLEQLRRKRIDRMKIPPGIPSLSDYAFVRRQFNIFERAVAKFKSDVGLWVQYIQVAKREGASALIGRITARALQLHPTTPSLYILAASHELTHLSPSAARTLLQRGIRLNPDSVDLWRECVRLELGFIESLRRRWEVMGIDNPGLKNKKGKEKADTSRYFVDLGEEQNEEEVEEEEGIEAREEIMRGAIVKSVITSAGEALPKVETFSSIISMVAEYPSSDELRKTVLDHVYHVIRKMLPNDPKAMQLLALRFLPPDLKGESLVNGLHLANEDMLTKIGTNSNEGMYEVYANFVEQWCDRLADDNLRQYLISSLLVLIQKTGRPSPSLLSVHIRLMTLFADSLSTPPAKVLRLAQKYTTKAPNSSRVWLARLEAEKWFGSDGVETTWAEARQSTAGSEEELIKVWTWDLSDEKADKADDRLTVHETLLKESMVDSSLRGVHEIVLMNYVSVLHEVSRQAATGSSDQLSAWWVERIRRVGRGYLTTGRVWQKVFRMVESDTGIEERGKEKILGEIYEHWRQEDDMEATIGWAGWMIVHGKGREASEVMLAAKGRVGSETARSWMGVIEERVGLALG